MICDKCGKKTNTLRSLGIGYLKKCQKCLDNECAAVGGVVLLGSIGAFCLWLVTRMIGS